jgi:hypothetical protein
LSHCWRRASDQLCKAAKVLRNSGECKLVLRAAWAAQPEPPQSQNALEMGKQHLDALSIAARPLEGFGFG